MTMAEKIDKNALETALKGTGYSFSMDISKPRANSVCCGDADDATNQLALFPWRKARLYIGIDATAGTSLVLHAADFTMNANGPDEANAQTGGTDTLSDQFLEEDGALVPSQCHFVIMGFGVEVNEPYECPVTGATAGDPTYTEFFGSEGALGQSYTKQLKTALMRHSHIEIQRKGNSCRFVSTSLDSLPMDAGINSIDAVKSGSQFTNTIGLMRTPVIVSGVNESNALQLKYVLDRTVTISSHAGNPVASPSGSNSFFIPVDMKIYGTSLPPSIGCP
jgi:hypothetical protein